MLTTGNCYACGSTPATQGCKVCTEVMTCQTCISGLVLNSTNQCTAESIDESKNNGIYVVLVIVMSIAIGILNALIGYNHYKKTASQAAGLYSQIQ